MNILAFDCAGRSCRAALMGEGGVLAKSAVEDRGQAEALVPLLVELVARAGLDWPDIGLIGVTVGPGGFTGVRIGLAAARGLALAGGIPVAGVSSLAALAHGVDAAERRGRVVVAVVGGGGARLFAQPFGIRPSSAQPFSAPGFIADPEPLSPPLALAPEAMATGIGIDRPLLVGDGAARLLPLWPGASLASAPIHPDPEKLAWLALHDHRAGCALPPLPLYLQPPDVTIRVG